jgi:hypothetical protein
MTAPKMIELEIPQAIKHTFAHHSDYIDTPEQLAVIAGVELETVQSVLSDPASVSALVAHRKKLEINGALLPGRARRALDMAVDAIKAELSKGVDGFEAAELAKPLIRILENSERVRLAERDDGANAKLATFNFIFTNGGVTAHQVLPPIEVIDVATTDVVALTARSST